MPRVWLFTFSRIKNRNTDETVQWVNEELQTFFFLVAEEKDKEFYLLIN